MSEGNDLLKLMTSIQSWMLNQKGSGCQTVAADAELAAFFKDLENRREGLMENRKRFKAATEVLDHMDVNLENALVGLTNKAVVADETTHDSSVDSDKGDSKEDKAVCNKDKAIADRLEFRERTKMTQRKTLDRFLACRFLAGADKTMYGNVSVYLKNEFVVGVKKF